MEDPTPEQVEAPEGGCGPMGGLCWNCDPMERGAQAGAGLLAGLVTPWGTHAGAVREELQPVEGLTLEKITEDSLP